MSKKISGLKTEPMSSVFGSDAGSVLSTGAKMPTNGDAAKRGYCIKRKRHELVSLQDLQAGLERAVSALEDLEVCAMSKKSPMSLSLDYLNKLGWTCQIVEKRLPIPGRNVTQDCFGFGDILAYHSTSGISLVQTTSWANFSTRKAKIDVSPHSARWKAAGGKIFLHGWGDKGLREEEL